jgi:very-short-patch-repair endonuclease
VLQHRPFLARQVIGAGLLTRGQLRGPTWRRLLRGVYADAAIPVDHGLKIRGAVLVIPPDAALTGLSAAWLWGARLASPYDPVDVVRPPDRRLGLTCGLRVRSSPLPASDVETLSGVRLTTPLRTAWELALRLHLVEAVVYCDALAARGRIDQAGLTGYVRERAGEHGCRIARRVFSLVDGRSESPQESRLRVWLALAGLRPVLQHEVWVAGEFVARVDFAWPDLKVAVEYDGVWHADAGQLVRDRERLNRLQAAGWYVHHVTVHDMSDIQRTVATIREVLDRRTRS